MEEPGETILVVDDAEAVRKLVCAMLSSAGYQYLEACDGHEALQVMENDPLAFELVITDMVMPNMSGVELARHLNRMRPEVPIVFMSGFMDDPLMQQMDPEAVFLSKPFTASALLAVVRRSLEQLPNQV